MELSKTLQAAETTAAMMNLNWKVNMNTVNLLGTVFDTPSLKGGKKVKFKLTCTHTRISADGNTEKIKSTITCIAFGDFAKAIAENVKKGELWEVSGYWAVTPFVGADGNKTISNELVVTLIAKPLKIIKGSRTA